MAPADFYPGRNSAGHKRKLDFFRGSSNERGHRERAPAPPTVPSVPSFGTIGVGTNTDQLQHSNNARQRSVHNSSASKQGAAAPRGLGLTVQDEGPVYSSDSEDDGDGDEEVALKSKLPDSFTFIDHNFNRVTIASTADVAAWMTARRKNFPSKAHTLVKLEQKREEGERRMHLLYTARMDLYSDDMILSVKAQHEQDKAAATKSSARSRVLVEADRGADVDHAPPSDEDAPPEELTTKAPSSMHANEGPRLARDTSGDLISEIMPAVAPERREALPRQKSKLCGFHNTPGGCKDGDKCVYRHVDPHSLQPAMETQDCGPGYDRTRSRPTHGYLSDILLSQEKSEQNSLALKVIKHLGEAAFFALHQDQEEW